MDNLECLLFTRFKQAKLNKFTIFDLYNRNFTIDHVCFGVKCDFTCKTLNGSS